MFLNAPVWRQIAKFNAHQYFRLYGIWAHPLTKGMLLVLYILQGINGLALDNSYRPVEWHSWSLVILYVHIHVHNLSLVFGLGPRSVAMATFFPLPVVAGVT